MDTSVVTLQFFEQTNQVKAVVQFPEDVSISTFTLDDIWLQQALKKNNFDQFFVLPDGVAALKAAVQAKQSTIIAIAEKRDAEIIITIEDNNMHAYLQICSAFGGKNAVVDDVINLIKHKRIKEGIDQEAIQHAVEHAKCARVLIASGRIPIDGEDGYFQTLVAADKHYGPIINEQGVANFLEVNELFVVQQGDKLMRKIPRTLGENGVDVFGNVLYPVPGKNIQFPETLSGAIINQEDESLLIATIKGHPIIEKNSVRVDPIYMLDKVDLSTGNVNFDGSVLVKGDVESNMKVEATGDIIVNGCVIKAEIIAGGKVVISQGIIGGESIKTKEGIMQRGVSIKSGGVITTGFIDNAAIEAQGNILVKDYISNSDVISSGDIVVGSAGYKGYIVGGTIQALHMVRSNVLGSSSEIVTKIKVGASLELSRTYDHKLQKLQKCEATLNSLSKAFIEIGKRESEGQLTIKTKKILASLVSTLKSIVPNVSVLGSETCVLKSQIGEHKTAKIVVCERVFCGVELNLYDKVYIIKRDMVGGAFELSKGEVVVSPIGLKLKAK